MHSIKDSRENLTFCLMSMKGMVFGEKRNSNVLKIELIDEISRLSFNRFNSWLNR